METRVSNIIKNYDVLLCNLQALRDGEKFSESALQTLKEAHQKGKKIILVDNSQQRASYIESYYARDIVQGTHFDKLVTSGEQAYEQFSKDPKNLRYAVIGRSDDSIFSGSVYIYTSELEKADFVYLARPQYIDSNGLMVDADDLSHFQPELDKACQMHKKFVCANPDLKAYAANQRGKIVLGAGAMGEYCRQKGCQVQYIGKPNKSFYQYALQGETSNKSKIVMIGDLLETDIKGALSAGIDSILLKDGLSFSEMLHSPHNGLEPFAKSRHITPTYFADCF